MSRFKYWALDDKDTESIQTLIPELRESEDERIRKELIDILEKSYEFGGFTLNSKKDLDRYLAYLEKQKDIESKYAGMVVVSQEEWDTAIADAFKHGMDEGEKQKEQKPNFDTHWENGSMVCEQKEQKVEWSDEDIEKNLIAYLRYERKSTPQEIEEKFIPYIKRIRDMYKHAIKSLDRYNNLKEKIDKMAVADALEELKLVAGVRAERESKQEWSEENEEIIANAIKQLYSYADSYHNASNYTREKEVRKVAYELKSLRPQSKDETYKEKDEAFKLGRHQLAIKFMNYLDDNNISEGKTGLSDGECEDIDEAFEEGDWAKILRYAEKYGKEN